MSKWRCFFRTGSGSGSNMLKGVIFPNKLEAFDQSQHTGPANQSEHIVLFKQLGFIEKGTKKSVTDRLGKVLQQ